MASEGINIYIVGRHTYPIFMKEYSYTYYSKTYSSIYTTLSTDRFFYNQKKKTAGPWVN